MANEIESGFYNFRYSYVTEDGSLTVNYFCEHISDKDDLKSEINELIDLLKSVYEAKEINITYKLRRDE